MLHSAIDPGFVAFRPPAYLRRKQKDRLFLGVLLDSYAALRVEGRLALWDGRRGDPSCDDSLT